MQAEASASTSGSRRVSHAGQRQPPRGIKFVRRGLPPLTQRGEHSQSNSPVGLALLSYPAGRFFAGHLMRWTPERLEATMKLWKAGHSASIIAARLTGVTRNAVIGAVHRHGRKYGVDAKIVRKRRPGVEALRQYAAVRRARAAAATKLQMELRKSSLVKLPKSPLAPHSQTDVARVSMARHVEGQCRFPVGDFISIDTPWYCGDKIVPGLPYCEHHACRCYAPPTPRSNAPAPRHAHNSSGKIREMA